MSSSILFILLGVLILLCLLWLLIAQGSTTQTYQYNVAINECELRDGDYGYETKQECIDSLSYYECSNGCVRLSKATGDYHLKDDCVAACTYYKCGGGGCVLSDDSEDYLSQQECHDKCTTTQKYAYDFNEQKCMKNPYGAYFYLEDCENAERTFDCVEGMCVNVENETGYYDSVEECQANSVCPHDYQDDLDRTYLTGMYATTDYDPSEWKMNVTSESDNLGNPKEIALDAYNGNSCFDYCKSVSGCKGVVMSKQDTFMKCQPKSKFPATLTSKVDHYVYIMEED